MLLLLFVQKIKIPRNSVIFYVLEVWNTISFTAFQECSIFDTYSKKIGETFSIKWNYRILFLFCFVFQSHRPALTLALTCRTLQGVFFFTFSNENTSEVKTPLSLLFSFPYQKSTIGKKYCNTTQYLNNSQFH